MSEKDKKSEDKVRKVNFITFEQESFKGYKQDNSLRQNTNTTSIKTFVKEFIKS